VSVQLHTLQLSSYQKDQAGGTISNTNFGISDLGEAVLLLLQRAQKF